MFVPVRSLILIAAIAAALGQAPNVDKEFDVVSVKQARKLQLKRFSFRRFGGIRKRDTNNLLDCIQKDHGRRVFSASGGAAALLLD
jgi:hypothetical protein